nr:asialoglycoprotein receptor 1-like [Misgurnus anguillicaudatus]
MSEVIYDEVTSLQSLELDRGERVEMMVDFYQDLDAVRNDEVMINTKRQQELQHTEKRLLILQIHNLTKERDELLTNNTNLLNEINQCQKKPRSLSEERGQLIHETEECKKWLTEQDQRSDNFEWIYYNFSCYYISSEWRNWSDSRRDCEQRGADLVIINNKEEQEFVQKATAGFKFWIGLSKERGVWKWVDDTTLTLSFWINGHPGSYNHSCAVITTPGWTDHTCHKTHRWICEKRFLQ